MRQIENTENLVNSLAFVRLQHYWNAFDLLPFIDCSPYLRVGHFGYPVNLQPANLCTDCHQKAVLAWDVPKTEIGPAIALRQQMRIRRCKRTRQYRSVDGHPDCLFWTYVE